jgi:Cu/Zn superoxide dismutase
LYITSSLPRSLYQIRIDAGFSGLDQNSSYNFHVHTYGVYSKDGMAAGPHLGNCNGTVCRPTAPAADQSNAGWMPNAPRNFLSDNTSQFQTAFYDDLLSLNGYFSVIGRSVVLHNGTGARVGFCVIGRGDSAAVEALAPLVNETVLVPRRLSCNLVPTQDGIDSGERVTGTVVFDAADVDVGVNVSWAIDGFAPNVIHHFHIHQEGNIADPKAAILTQGHFNGSCVDCRPGFPAKLQEVGQIGNGFELVADSNVTLTGEFYDSLPQMRGLRSIVGRSIVGMRPCFQKSRVAHSCFRLLPQG